MLSGVLNSIEQGEGFPVVLIHGVFGSASNLGNLARVLAENFRVISVDLRNHGDSPRDDVMDLPALAQDVIALLDALSIRQAHIVGHSLGGKIGMQIALNFPACINRLVVADISPVKYEGSHERILKGLEVLHNSTLVSRSAADKILADYEANPGVRGFLLKNLYRKADGSYGLKLNVPALLANYSEKLTAAPAGSAFDGEVLFIKGETSAYMQENHRETICRLFPNAQFRVIAGAGHWLHADKPAEFNRLVLDFLAP